MNDEANATDVGVALVQSDVAVAFQALSNLGEVVTRDKHLIEAAEYLLRAHRALTQYFSEPKE